MQSLLEATKQVNLLLEFVHSVLKEVDSTITLQEIKWIYTLFTSRSFGVQIQQLQNTTRIGNLIQFNTSR